MESDGATEARDAWQGDDMAGARERLLAAIRQSPGDGEGPLALGRLEMSLGNYEAALAAFTSATLLLPKTAAAYSSRALACQKLGRSKQAAQAAIRAVSLDPADALALKVLARIHLDAGQHEAAEQACRLVLQRDARDAEAAQMMGEALAQEAKLAENLFVTADPQPKG